MVIKIKKGNLKVRNCRVTARAGVLLDELIKIATENSLTGLEFMAGIYGTVGGAVFGNAGAWQENIGDKVKKVRILDKNNQLEWLNQEECHFAYRQSRFKKSKENFRSRV